MQLTMNEIHLFQTSVARSILSALNNIPTVLILSQDSFYQQHSPEEIEMAFKNDLDLGGSRKSPVKLNRAKG